MTTLFPSGLRGRLLLLFLAAFAVMFGMLAWYALEQREEQLSAAKERVWQSVKLITAEEKSIVKHADQLLLALIRLPQLRQDQSPEECSRVLSAWEKAEEAFFNIGLVKTNGDIVCMAAQTTSSINVADRAYFQQALKTHDLVIGDAIVSRGTGRSTIVFAKSIWDGAEQASGVFFVSLDLAWLNRELAKTPLPAGSNLVVADSQGTILARYPEPEGWVGKSVAELPLFKLVIEKGEGVTEESGVGGTPRILAFAPLMDTIGGRAYLWIGIPKDVVTGQAERRFVRLALISLALLAATFGMLWLGGARWFLRPVSALSGAAQRIGHGNLAARTGLVYADDELGRLARSFDDMAEGIESREKQLSRTNRALRLLSAGNQTMLRVNGEPALIEAMCRVIVQTGGYRVAWVAYAEHDRGESVRTVAAWGAERGFLDALKITWNDAESGRGPIGTAISRGIPVASNDIAADPDYGLWRDLARRHGIASALALPLQVGGAVIGALCIGAAEPGAFDEDVIELLTELANDLAFGIATQRAAIEHGRTRAALQSAEERFRVAAKASLDALFILKSVRGNNDEIVDFEFLDVNPSAERMLGMAHDQVVGQKLCELFPISRSGGFFEKYAAVATTGTPLEEEFPIDTPEIKAKWLRQQIVRVDDGIAISSRDITEWKQAGAALKESERTYRSLFDNMLNGIAYCRMLFDNGKPHDFIYLKVNDAFEVLTGLKNVIGKNVTEVIPGIRKTDPGLFEIYGRVALSGKPERFEIFVEALQMWFSLSVFSPQNEHFVAVFDVISERKKAELGLARANRALRTLSASNEALVRATSEEELLQSVTCNIVKQGGYRMARVSYAEDDPEKSLRRVAWAGAGDDFHSEHLTWADTEMGQLPSARAIRSAMPVVCHDIAGDPGFAPWKDAALAQGHASNIGLPLSDGRRTFGCLSIYSPEKDAFDDEEVRLLAELANNLAYGIVTLRTRAERDRIAYAHAHHAQILQKSLEQSIQVIAATVEARDPYTAGHQRRVGELAVAIARELGLPEEKIQGIHLAAVIHDLGKINVPAEILAKPGKLSNIEFELIKTHPQAGYDILKDVDFPWPIADIVRQHHEKLDGSGYPQGLKDGQILFESRIMAVADVVEAIASHRPYRPALGVEVALKEIERGRGSAYDPAVADACLNLFREGRFAFQV